MQQPSNRGATCLLPSHLRGLQHNRRLRDVSIARVARSRVRQDRRTYLPPDRIAVIRRNNAAHETQLFSGQLLETILVVEAIEDGSATMQQPSPMCPVGRSATSFAG